ncbi:MAG TPA: thioredoxin-disulfide reductase [Myxococcaceae bacterium]|nr:thioredoxin-disulfide reductase [Myxococcaceae bacterium]
MADTVHAVTIIGSGPAGYTAAIYAARANLHPVLYAGGPALDEPARVPGGQLMITTDVENYPGFPEAITGPELMERFKAQAERFGTVVHMENVMKVDLSARPFTLTDESGRTVRTKTVIIATGASAKWLCVPGETEYANRGVSACATCDGAFFKGEEVFVVGGGDTAMEEATYLAKIVNKVTLLHRRDQFRASKIMQHRVLSNPKISVVWNTVVEEVLGDGKRVTGVRVRNVKAGEVMSLSGGGVFVAIGHKPTTQLFDDWLETDDVGYIRTVPGSTRTSLDGVFACGDVQDAFYRQAVTAAGTGCMAAIEAERFLVEHGE